MSYDEFRSAYVTTMLWSSIGEDGRNLDDTHDETDLAPEGLALVEKDCRAFYDAHSAMFTDEHCLHYGPDFEIDGRAGHDFWLTRCGHGAGFWDGDWAEPAATTLDSAAKAFGNLDPYLGDDGLIYLGAA